MNVDEINQFFLCMIEEANYESESLKRVRKY